MTDCLADIFSRHLPSEVGTVAGGIFAEGMRSYHDLFKSYRDRAMNYESLPEYQNAQHCVMRVGRDEFWPYSPHFRKAVALIIQELFKTKITAVAVSPVSMEQMVVFVDESKNRWIMVTDECAEADSCLNRICMFFPRSNTPVLVQGIPTPLKHLNDPALGKSCLALVVADVACWNE
jgi:hypothetical protein